MKMVFLVVCALSVHLVVGKLCPGGQQTCEARTTCCALPSGREGCCPYENATCCPDKVHCCPNGYDCTASKCRKEEDGIPVVKVPATIMVDNEEDNNINANASSIICPDASQCEDDDTCCSVGHDEYGCCPMPNAVCCSDLRTCCPDGYTCVGQGGCERENSLLSRAKVSPKSIVCPGSRFKCPDYNTCCRMPGGKYGCCPLYHAVCCRDGKHCCPNGYTCDPYSEQCNKS